MSILLFNVVGDDGSRESFEFYDDALRYAHRYLGNGGNIVSVYANNVLLKKININ